MPSSSKKIEEGLADPVSRPAHQERFYRKPPKGCSFGQLLIRYHLQINHGVGGRDRDRTIQRSTTLVSFDEVLRLGVRNSVQQKFKPCALKHCRTLALRLSIDDPFHTDFDAFEWSICRARE